MAMIIDGTNGLTFNNSTVQASAGQVLQVVNVSHGTETTNATSTFADTGLTATITPKFSTSKILVLITQAGCGKYTNDTSLRLRLLRGASEITTIEDTAALTGTGTANYIGACSSNYLDSPATTSATTYKTQFASRANNSGVIVQAFGATSGYTRSTMTLLEIAG
jgi:hypothetical protein